MTKGKECSIKVRLRGDKLVVKRIGMIRGCLHFFLLLRVWEREQMKPNYCEMPEGVMVGNVGGMIGIVNAKHGSIECVVQERKLMFVFRKLGVETKLVVAVGKLKWPHT